jgi:DNA-binding NtrC family response regulator
MTAKILIADDERSVIGALKLYLKRENIRSQGVSTPAAVLEALQKERFDLLLMDLNYDRDTTSGSEGLDLITRVRALDGQLPIIVMTGWGSIDIAVDAMRRGANDFIEKPWDNQRLVNIIQNLLALARSQRKSARLESENALLKADSLSDSWICESAAMRDVMKQVDRIAKTDINVLLTGENGTGKSHGPF